MLGDYLKALREQAGMQEERHVSFEKHAHAAGVRMPESMCPECGGEMAKTASLWSCSCGMMKKAEDEPFYMKPPHPAFMALAGGIGAHAAASLAGASPTGKVLAAGGGAVGLGALGAAARHSYEQRQAAREQDMLMGHHELNNRRMAEEDSMKVGSMIALLSSSFEKNAELWQQGVLEQGHTGDGEKVRLLPALGDTPDTGDSRREEQLGERRHQEAEGVSGGTETGTRDIGVGPPGLTYELTNRELVKRAYGVGGADLTHDKKHLVLHQAETGYALGPKEGGPRADKMFSGAPWFMEHLPPELHGHVEYREPHETDGRAWSAEVHVPIEVAAAHPEMSKWIPEAEASHKALAEMGMRHGTARDLSEIVKKAAAGMRTHRPFEKAAVMSPALIGGLIGAGTGALAGGQGNRMKGALVGGGLGAAGGHLLGKGMLRAPAKAPLPHPMQQFSRTVEEHGAHADRLLSQIEGMGHSGSMSPEMLRQRNQLMDQVSHHVNRQQSAVMKALSNGTEGMKTAGTVIALPGKAAPVGHAGQALRKVLRFGKENSGAIAGTATGAVGGALGAGEDHRLQGAAAVPVGGLLGLSARIQDKE